jgi:hypothetical protein
VAIPTVIAAMGRDATTHQGIGCTASEAVRGCLGNHRNKALTLPSFGFLTFAQDVVLLCGSEAMGHFIQPKAPHRLAYITLVADYSRQQGIKQQ